MRDFLAQTLAESPAPRVDALYLLGNVPGLPPIAQSFHILGIATVVGSIVMVDLKFLGLALPGQNVSEMIRRLLPWTWCALGVNFGHRDAHLHPGAAHPLFLQPGCHLQVLDAARGRRARVHRLLDEPAGSTASGRRLGRAAARGADHCRGVDHGSGSASCSADAGSPTRSTSPIPSRFPFDWESLQAYQTFWLWLQDHPISQHIGYTWWFPLLESIHVIAIGHGGRFDHDSRPAPARPRGGALPGEPGDTQAGPLDLGGVRRGGASPASGCSWRARPRTSRTPPSRSSSC